jgi:hypothetical protein
VELFSTIHRLAGTGQYDSRDLPEYIQDVEAHFGSYRNHHAVYLVKKLRKTYGLDGNSPMALAVYLTDPPEHKGRSPLHLPPADLDRRWTEDVIPLMLEAAREFAQDTDFLTFFDTQQPLYERAVQNLKATLKDTHMLAWFEGFFGDVPDNYVIILGLQNGSCNYGASVILSDGVREFNSILGATRPDSQGAPQYPRPGYIPIIVHEFCHSIVNPLVDRHHDSLPAAGEAIFPSQERALKRWGYNLWDIMLYEYITRACVILYLLAEEGRSAAQNKIEMDKKAGFPGIQELVEVLTAYEEQRTRYPRLDDFMPRTAAFFEKYAESFL